MTRDREYAFWRAFVTLAVGGFVLAVVIATLQGHYEPLIGSLIGALVLAVLIWCIRSDERN